MGGLATALFWVAVTLAFGAFALFVHWLLVRTVWRDAKGAFAKLPQRARRWGFFVTGAIMAGTFIAMLTGHVLYLLLGWAALSVVSVVLVVPILVWRQSRKDRQLAESASPLPPRRTS